jgi:addiction module HigA family antidote
VLPELGITQATLASLLGVSGLTVSDLFHEKRALTAEMAVRVAKVIGGTPEGWLCMQEALDRWEEKHEGYLLRR